MRRASALAAEMEVKLGRLVLIAALALFSLSTAPARAQSEVIDVSIEACVDAAGASIVALQGCKGRVSEPCLEQPGGETTAGARLCFLAEESSWTAQLQAALARAQADASRADFLRQSQDAWNAWRQAECRYQASLYEGGSLARVLGASCAAELTADRAIALIYAERTREE